MGGSRPPTTRPPEPHEYSTGDTHYIVYSTSNNPLCPFVYKGRILEPVLGWTSHHSIVDFQGR